jgi:tetratricopeptide (TPR) repeat protein
MAYHRQGKSDLAREALDRARGNFDATLAKIKGGTQWHNWLICRILLSEAETVVRAGYSSAIDLFGDPAIDTETAERNVAELDRCLDTVSGDWLLHLDRAIYLTYLNRWDEAGDEMRQATTLSEEAVEKLSDLVSESLQDQSSRMVASDNKDHRRTFANPKAASLMMRQALWALNHLIDITPPDEQPPVYTRARVHGCLRNWQEALNDLERAVELDPNRDFAWYCMGPLLLELNQQERYEQHCRETLEKFDESAGFVIHGRGYEQMLWCKDSPHDWERMAAYFEDYLTSRRVGSAAMPWHECAAGVACYRSGRLDAALNWLRKTLDENPPVYCEARARSALAMVYHVQGNHDEARQMLDQARAMFSERIPALDEGPIGNFWQDWLVAKILLSEAEELIRGDPAARQGGDTSEKVPE